MKEKIAALLRRWANKLNPQVITCRGEDPLECSYIPIKSQYKIVPVRCAYLFPHRKSEPIDPENIPPYQMEYAHRHIAEEFVKAVVNKKLIKFDIRTTYGNEVMLEGELYIGVKQEDYEREFLP